MPYRYLFSFPELTGEKYDITFMGKKIATVENEELTEIVCHEEGQLPGLLTDAIKREAQVLAISGPVNGADLKAINLTVYDALLGSAKKSQDIAIGEASIVESIHMLDSHNSPYYDLQGRYVANPTRGIYIKDGKKVVIK